MSLGQSTRDLARRVRALYRMWAWPAAPRRCGSIRAIAIDAGGSVAPRCAEREQVYGLPASADNDVLAFFGAFARLQMPEEVRCVVPEGRVVGPGVVLSPDGQTLARDVSVVFGGTPHDHPMLHCERIPPARRLRGRTLNVASAGGQSYYHWLIDELPRLLETILDKHDTVIGHRGHLARVADAVGFQGNLIIADTRHHFRCDELAVSSIFGISGHPTPQAVAVLRDFASRYGLAKAAAGHGLRIFISRAAATVRRLVREHDIWPCLERQGFTRLFLEQMSWDEQIRAFGAADIVVAPHGAGLANLVFCRPGTRVIELFDRRYVHWCYWQLASACGLEYHAVASEGNSPPSHDFRHLGSDIDIGWGRIRSKL